MDTEATQDLFDTTDNKNYGNTELAKYAKVEGTPFTIAMMEEQYYVLIGKYRLTEAMETEAQALEDAKRVDWERMMQVMQIMITENK